MFLTGCKKNMRFLHKTVSICTLLLLFINRAAAIIFDAKHASNLEIDIATNYRNFVRPNASTEIFIGFAISHITKLDIVDQQFHVSGVFQLSWHDYRLQWAPQYYGNMTRTYIKMSSIWVPPIVLSNAANSFEMISDNSDLASAPVLLFNNGIILWLAPVNFISQCTINIQYYPFDIQTCHLLMALLLYNAEEVKLIIEEDDEQFIRTELYEKNGEWDIIDANVELGNRLLEGYPMSAVKFSLTLKRKYSYYLLTMVLPVIFLALLGAFVFMLPVECGEKIGFGLTILLSLSVVMTIVSDNIPPVSSSTCILSVYLLTTYIICTCEVLITVLNLRIHNLQHLGYKPSISMRTFMSKYLAKIARHKRASDVVKDEMRKQTKCKGDDDKISVQTIETENRVTAWQQEIDDGKSWDDNVYTYTDLSNMLDTICFVFFFVLTVLVVIVFLLVLMVGGGQSG